MRGTAVATAVVMVAALTGACAGSAADAPACDPAIADALAAWADAGFSGSVAVLVDGDVECLAASGMADEAAGRPNAPDTVFSIGSVTKAVTAASIYRLVDEGRLDLSERAGDIVPGLDGPVAGATVEQLLLHTSGLTGSLGPDHEPLSKEQAIAALNGLELAFDGGTDFLYSNAGYTLLAMIVEQRSGTTYRDATMQVLALPDGGVAGGFWDGEPAAPGPRAIGYLEDGAPSPERGDFAGPHWALDGNGALAMTMLDLASWTRALFTGHVLSPASTAAIAEPGFAHADGVAETPGWVRYDASFLGEPAYTSAGGGGDIGHEVTVAWLPASDRVVAIASNTDRITAEQLLDTLGPAFVAGDPLPRPAVTPIDVDPAQLAAMAGDYALDDGGTLTVRATSDAALTIAAQDGPAIAALFPRPAGADEHEAQVTALLSGETSAGRAERSAIESDLGPIEDFVVLGSVEYDDELRTYATITAGGRDVLAWYSLDDAGGVEAAEIDTDPPGMRFVPVGAGVFRVDDPTGHGPDVSVEITDGALRVTSDDHLSIAHRAPS